jgi:hypothetical protein
LLQAAMRGRHARQGLPRATSKLYVMLNNTAYAIKELSALERRQLGADSGLVLGSIATASPAGSDATAGSADSAGPLEAARRECEATGIELIRYLIRRLIFGRLPVDRIRTAGSLAEYLEFINAAGTAVAAHVLPPWRLPLLFGLYGSLLLTLEMADTQPELLEEMVVDASPVSVLDLKCLQRLKDALRQDGLHLDPAIEANIRLDAEAAKRDPEGIGALQRRALSELDAGAASLRQLSQKKARLARHVLAQFVATVGAPEAEPWAERSVRAFTRARTGRKASRRSKRTMLRNMPNVSRLIALMSAETNGAAAGDASPRMGLVDLLCACSPRANRTAGPEKGALDDEMPIRQGCEGTAGAGPPLDMARSGSAVSGTV